LYENFGSERLRKMIWASELPDGHFNPRYPTFRAYVLRHPSHKMSTGDASCMYMARPTGQGLP
jgi:hypothetical protein